MSKPADKEDIAKLEKLILDRFDKILTLINLLIANINPSPIQYRTSVSDPGLIKYQCQTIDKADNTDYTASGMPSGWWKGDDF